MDEFRTQQPGPEQEPECTEEEPEVSDIPSPFDEELPTSEPVTPAPVELEPLSPEPVTPSRTSAAPPTTEKKRNKNNTGVIIAIVVAVILLLCCCFGMVVLLVFVPEFRGQPGLWLSGMVPLLL